MELGITTAESSSLPILLPKRNRPEGCTFRKSALNVKRKQYLVINSATIKVPTRVKRSDHATLTNIQKGERKKPSIKE